MVFQHDTPESETLDSVGKVPDVFYPFVVSFGCLNESVSPPALLSYSGFLIEINGHWLICTAAHNFDEIKTAVDAGLQLKDWHIDDGILVGISKGPAYPFNPLRVERLNCEIEALGADFALVLLDSLTVRNLQARGMRALNSSHASDGYASNIEKWFVVGVPAAKIQQRGDSVLKMYASIPATPLFGRPSYWDEGKRLQAIFASLDETNAQQQSFDIRGMSGGPVFGILRNEEGRQYWAIVGVQSTWNEQRRVICVAPITPFFSAIEKTLEEMALQ